MQCAEVGQVGVFNSTQMSLVLAAIRSTLRAWLDLLSGINRGREHDKSRYAFPTARRTHNLPVGGAEHNKML